MRSARPSRSFTRRTSRLLSQLAEHEGSRSRCGASGAPRSPLARVGQLQARALEGSRGRRRVRRPLLHAARGAVRGARRCPARSVGEVRATSSRAAARLFEVAHRDHDQVVGRVPALEEAAHALAVEARDALGTPEDGRAIGMDAVGLGEDGVRQHRPGRVLRCAGSPRAPPRSRASISSGSKVEWRTASLRTSMPTLRAGPPGASRGRR